jgi:hypothetical protein
MVRNCIADIISPFLVARHSRVVESVHRCWVAYDRHGRERVLLFVRARASSGSPNCTFGPWRDGWSFEAKDQFINDVLDAYESVIGAPGVFRFL